MSRLFLVRHAQASFLAPDYDKLSSLGERQASLLGEFWAGHKMRFDRSASGPCRRQIHTAKIVHEVFRTSGRDFPEPAVIPEFDEYPGEAILEHGVPILRERDRDFRGLYEAYRACGSFEDRRKNFQKVYEILIGAWVEDSLPIPGAESWAEFTSRVNRGLSRFLSESSRGEQSVIFCSGGPVAVAVQRSLNLSPRDTLRIAWMSRNCSYTEFLASAGKFTLSSFNSSPHLDDASYLTYW